MLVNFKYMEEVKDPMEMEWFKFETKIRDVLFQTIEPIVDMLKK